MSGSTDWTRRAYAFLLQRPAIAVSIFLVIVVALVAAAIVWPDRVDQFGWVALVAVTLLYALFTGMMAVEIRQQSLRLGEQLDLLDKQRGLLKEQQYNAVAPVVHLDAFVDAKGDVTVTFRNVGLGPALNLRCWIDDEEHPELRANLSKVIDRGVVGVGEGYAPTIPTGVPGYKLGIGYVRCQYKDIFGRVYESALMMPANAKPDTKYGVAKHEEVF